MINLKGLSSAEASSKQKQFGKNEIRRTKKVNPLKIFLSQFTSPLIILLILAAIISIGIGYLPGQVPNFIDAILILVIVFASGISGFFQEYQAEKSIEALQQYSTPVIQAVRDGKTFELSVVDLVPGDIVLLEAGDIVPADGQILESFNLGLDESILTGESAVAEKKSQDEVFMGTSVYVGSAKVAITKIGMKTDIGKIADKLQQIEKGKTVFEEEIENFSKKIFWLTGVVSIFVFVGNFLKYDLYESVLTTISLAVAAIPEGLPAVVVLALAVGAKSMHKNNALIRKLSVVESIGAVDIICSDKTGTITKNEMSVVHLCSNSKVLNAEVTDFDEREKKEVWLLVECGILCNNTKVSGHPEGKRKYLGDQTEIALIKIGESFGMMSEDLKNKYIRLDEISFSSDRKLMSVIVEDKSIAGGQIKVFSKGAPEVVLEKCHRILVNGQIREITLEEKTIISDENKNFASNALRVLGFAFKDVHNLADDPEKDLIWIGLQAMTDPPHDGMKEVLADCKTAGIRVIMITGDNMTTAKAVANLVGLDSAGVLSGADLDQLSDSELEKRLAGGVNIFARTTPFHKLKILKILQKKYRVVMTGDGVNDSLALKQADVGVAMGIRGTTVSKEASDIILLNDNFATIVVAIKEGRRIFDNIRKFIGYLLVSNFAEISVLFLSTIFFTLENPILLPAQILWINLLTDGLPALALGVDPAHKGIMSKKPRGKDEPIIDKKLGWSIVSIGTMKTIILLLTFLVILPRGEDVARTALFTGFVLYEFVRIASIRHSEKMSWFSNPWLISALTFSLLLQFIVLYSPLNVFFHVVQLGFYEWIVLGVGAALGYVMAIMITGSIAKRIR